MKKILSIILAIAMLMVLVPSVFAEGEGTEAATVLKYDFTSKGINGGTADVSPTTATYENTKSSGSAPWDFVNSLSANTLSSLSARLRYNWYNLTPPELGDRALVFMLQIPEGNYSARIAVYGNTDAPNSNIYLVPTSERELCQKLSETGRCKEGILEIPEKYFMGFANGYQSTAGEKNIALSGVNIASESEYYLVIASNGVDDNYKAIFTSSGKNLYDMGVCSFTLDKSDVTAVSASAPAEVINIGDEIYATAEITRGDNTYPGNENVTWICENTYAKVDAATGKITGVSEGVAKIKAIVGSVESEAISVAIVNPDKDVYRYVTAWQGVFNNLPENPPSNMTNGNITFLTNSRLYNVEPSASMPWRLICNKNIYNYQLYSNAVNASVHKDKMNDSFFAYDVYVPKEGVYELGVNSQNNNYYGAAKVYFAKRSDITSSTAVPSSSGPISEDDFVNEIEISNGAEAKKIGNVTVPVAGEYLVVIAPSDATNPQSGGYVFYNYTGFTLTPVQDEVLTQAFNPTPSDVPTQYNPSVEPLKYVNGEESTVEAISVSATDENEDGIYDVSTSTTDDTYKFLYWVKGKETSKIIVSRTENFTYTPGNGDVNFLIAVYEKDGETENKAEFYNANGQLIESVEGADVVTPDLPSMAGYGDAKKWVNAKGEKFDGKTSVTVSGTTMFIAEYDEPTETFTIGTTNCTTDKASYKYGELVTCTATGTEADGTFKCWTRDGQIVSTNPTYSFSAWKNHTVEAVYTTEVFTFTGAARKIVLEIFGKNVMAEFIGFTNVVEKGIILDTKEIAMTTEKTQFTVEFENAASAKGYVIVKNSDNTYTKYTDGEISLTSN